MAVHPDLLCDLTAIIVLGELRNTTSWSYSTPSKGCNAFNVSSVSRENCSFHCSQTNTCVHLNWDNVRNAILTELELVTFSYKINNILRFLYWIWNYLFTFSNARSVEKVMLKVYERVWKSLSPMEYCSQTKSMDRFNDIFIVVAKYGRELFPHYFDTSEFRRKNTKFAIWSNSDDFDNILLNWSL